MFGSKAKGVSAEPTVIGRGTMIEGTVRVSGRVQVDGEIDGALIAEGHVSIGPSGVVLGELVASELALGGRVEGQISIRDHLHIAEGGIARGDVHYGSLQVDRGGVIDGSTLHGELTSTLEPGSPTQTLSSVPPPLPGRGVTTVS